MALALLLTAAACGGDNGDDEAAPSSGDDTTTTTTTASTTTAPGGGTALTIQGFAFDPPTLNVAVGTAVTVTNKDSASHTWTAEDDTWDSGNLSQNESFSFTFGQAGTFAYRCEIHTSMRGTVQVG